MIRRALAGLALLCAACSVDPGSDRLGTVAEGIAIDSVRFLPLGSRFALRDSATGIAFLGYHAGYVCARFLDLGLGDGPVGDPLAYRPATLVRLPGTDACALDSGNRDTVATHVFRDADTVRLATPGGMVTDAVRMVSGRFETDSLLGIPDSAGTLASGNLIFRGAPAQAEPGLQADSLPACRYIDAAEWEKRKDTLVVRITWVTLDPVTSAESCQGPSHADAFAPVNPSRKLRMGDPAGASAQ